MSHVLAVALAFGLAVTVIASANGSPLLMPSSFDAGEPSFTAGMPPSFTARGPPSLRLLATFGFRKPAFVSAVEVHADDFTSTGASIPAGTSIPTDTSIPSPAIVSSTTLDLLVTTFGVDLTGKHPDGVWALRDFPGSLKRKSFSSSRVGGGLTWPNEATLLSDGQLVVAGGFLVPGKKGHISVMDYGNLRKSPPGTEFNWRTLVEDDKGAFFHRVREINIHGRATPPGFGDDGRRLVSCRGRKGVLNGGSGEMVYLEPSADVASGFEVRVMKPGCDCFFTTVDYNGDGIPEFLIPEFFGKRLILQWTEHPDGDYTDSSFIRQRVIDESMGAAFDVQSVDVDGDGTDEIVLTNHQSGKKFGGAEPAVFVYDVKVPEEPAHAAGFLVQKQGDDANFGATFATTTNITDFMSRIQFTRRTISGKLNVVNRSFMAAGPGGAQVVPAHVVNANDDVHHMPPVVIVSGDGTEKAYLLTRNVDSDLVDGGVVPEYTQTEFHDCKGTVGGILVRDLDGDGWQEVVVPCYDTNEIAVYTFAP